MTESLSIQQARKLVLLSQKLPPAKQSGRAIEATHTAIEHLGYIQIDTKLKLHINHLALEAIKINREAFCLALHKELNAFLDFHGCHNYQIHKTTPDDFMQVLLSVHIQNVEK